ncbi:MAG: hypothetical protein PF795_04540, partial [Kiritimatiellae bacterium]|nr:hypothetical protein [Kiritimatiellia bacterium]
MQKEAREKLEHQISENVTAFLGPVLLPKGDTVSATLDPPELAHAKNHFLTNPGCDLEGSLQIVSQRGEQALRFRTLMPFKEIFLRFSPKAPRAACYTWPARLLETPGFRFVQRASGGDKQTFWRLGLDDGGYVEGKIHPEAKAPNPCTPVYLGKNADYPDWIIQILREQGVFRLVLPQNPPSGKQNPGDAEHVKWTPNHVWQIIHEEAQKRFVDGLVTDDQEARHTVMGDYWFCFRSNLPQLLTHILLTSPRLSKEERTLVFQRLDTPLTAREPDSEDAGLASRLWQILRDEHAYIAHGLGTPRNGTLQWVDFLNPVDAASARTQFMKFASRSYDRVPISRRQTHPSFNGLICPVQTPESKRVGLSLHLSRT